MTGKCPKELVFEGYEDLYFIIALMKKHIDWPVDRDKAPVEVKRGKSVEEILAEGYLSARLKTPGLEALGVVLDADDRQPQSRYQAFRRRCSVQFPDLPSSLPKEGLVVENSENIRLGLWIMPDNESHGGIESLIHQLVPASDYSWKFAKQCADQSRERGATYREVHASKAYLYTWLAWLDRPGQRAARRS